MSPFDPLGFMSIFGPGTVKCGGCGQKNRVQANRPGPRCGRCGLPLKVKKPA